jgi:3-deoxy-manno-octulosonate cytidylyltransferase (CMP-KDO synthetase)
LKKIIIVIPARLKSKRLPNKPLLKINGIEMIIRTFNQCAKVINRNDIYVTTDSNKIVNLCKKNNIKSVLTSSNCLTGTDRIAEFSTKIRSKIYINVQGDEPIFNPKDLKKLISAAKKNPKIVLNGYCKIKNKKDFFDVNKPKVIFSKKKKLLYMSRAPIPFNKERKFVYAWRQVCAYSLPYTALKKFKLNKKKTTIENVEDLELLRFIEMGISVKMVKMSDKSISVDVKEDIRKVENFLKKKF